MYNKPAYTKKPTPVTWAFRTFIFANELRGDSTPRTLDKTFHGLIHDTKFRNPKVKNQSGARGLKTKRQQTKTARNRTTLHVQQVSKIVGTSVAYKCSLLELNRQFFYSATYWRLRLLSSSFYHPRVLKTNNRLVCYKDFRKTPHKTTTTPLLQFFIKKPPVLSCRINRKQLWLLFRMRFERFMFKALGCRVYVWFSNLWRTIGADIRGWFVYENFVVARLVKKGIRFTIREAQARILVKSAWLAVTMLGGVSVFMQMLSRMVRSFRSHWAVVMYTLRVLDACRCYFWYKTLMQYRMTVSGKFGGQLRASQKTFQHGVIKLNARAIDLDYYRIRTITKYGTFGLRFWVQFRDLRSVRTKKAAADPTSYITPKFRATKKKKG